MKKLLISLLICIMSCVMFLPVDISTGVNASVDTSTRIASSLTSRSNLDEFLARAGKNRTAFTTGEVRAAEYLADKMTTAGLEYYSGDSFLNTFGVRGKTSQNVIGVKKTAMNTQKFVIIGAHYDNTYSIGNTIDERNSNGVSDNATGVLCVLSLIDALENVTLPFDVVFIFYGAEELGLYGSYSFVNDMSALDTNNILLALNYDMVGTGDYNYYYAGESALSFASIWNNNTYDVSALTTKRISYIGEFGGSAYSHIGMQSDNLVYLYNNIKFTSFFSGNMDSSGTGYIESIANGNITHSAQDNVNNVIALYPTMFNSMNDVICLTYEAITASSFLTFIESVGNEVNFNFINNKYFIIAFAIVVMMFINSYFTKRYKNRILAQLKGV